MKKKLPKPVMAWAVTFGGEINLDLIYPSRRAARFDQGYHTTRGVLHGVAVRIVPIKKSPRRRAT